MEIFCFDYNNRPYAFSVFMKDTHLIPAGASVYSMAVSQKNEVYEKFAKDFDVHFIFNDCMPKIDFYAVPFLSIFAVDSSGGMFSSIGAHTDFESDAKIVYIAPDRTIFLLADNGKEFIANIALWKENMKPFSEVNLFSDISHAKEKYHFIELP